MSGSAYPLALPPGAAIVVGGNGALGSAIVRAFAKAGSAVAFSYRSPGARVDALAADASRHGQAVEALPCDLQDAASVAGFMQSAFARFPHVHSLVYAAGPDIPIRYLSEIDAETWQTAFDTDVLGFVELLRPAIPALRRGGGGAVTAVTTAATRRYPPKDALSAVPKAAVEKIVQALAREEGRYGIRANAVAPGWIGAGLGARIIGKEHGGQSEALTSSIPLRRLGTPEDVAGAVLFLSSEQASYVTGQVLAVDGGWQI